MIEGRRGQEELAREHYASDISDWKWPLKKAPVIAHIKARLKHSLLTSNHWHLKKKSQFMLVGVYQVVRAVCVFLLPYRNMYGQILICMIVLLEPNYHNLLAAHFDHIHCTV